MLSHFSGRRRSVGCLHAEQNNRRISNRIDSGGRLNSDTLANVTTIQNKTVSGDGVNKLLATDHHNGGTSLGQNPAEITTHCSGTYHCDSRPITHWCGSYSDYLPA